MVILRITIHPITNKRSSNHWLILVSFESWTILFEVDERFALKTLNQLWEVTFVSRNDI